MAEEVLHRELIANGRIVCYRFESLGAEASEAWYNDASQTFATWDSEHPILMLSDFRNVDNNLVSPEGMMLGRQFAESHHEGKTAFLVDKSKPALSTLMTFVNRTLEAHAGRGVFESEDEAIAWLLEK